VKDRIQVFARHGVVRYLHFGQFGISINGRENVVKIMRDPAGQRADSFHFLCLPKLLRELLALDEEADLDPEGTQHRNRFCFRFARLLSKEESEYAQNLAADFNREADPPMQSGASGFDASESAWIVRCIRTPIRLTGSPDLARQTLSP